MSYIKRMLKLAARVSRLKRDERRYYLGAVAERSDGIIVCAQNGSPPEPCAEHHCEFRLTRKLNKWSTVYLARTIANGVWANSRPCRTCQIAMKSIKVKEVYYTVGPDQYGCLKL